MIITPAPIPVIRCGGEINGRRKHLADIGDGQTGGRQAFDDGRLERSRGHAIVRADKYALRLKVPRQICAQRLADQQSESRRQLRRIASRDSADIVFAENRRIDMLSFVLLAPQFRLTSRARQFCLQNA